MSVSLNPAITTNTCAYPDCPTHDNATMRCSRCRSALYCGKACQTSHWPTHKTICKTLVSKNEVKKEKTPDSLDYPQILQDINRSLSNLKIATHLSTDFSQKELIGDFSEEDLQVLGYTQRELEQINQLFKDKWRGASLSKSTLSCFDYTLLVVGERGVRENLFTPIGNQSQKAIMEERLSRWGYEVTELPVKGDLVVYSNGRDFTHMGLYLQDGWAKSKFGNDISKVTTHLISDVYARYGNRVIYYHKNPVSEPIYQEANVIKIVYR